MKMIELRNKIKSKKPTFTRQDNHKKPKLGDKWRKPKGLQSKMRLHKRGYKRSPEVGWGSPKGAKHLSPEGLIVRHIRNEADIENITEKEGAMIAATVGQRKRVELVKKLIEKKITILNIKDPAAFIKKVDANLKQKKEDKAHAQKEKDKKTKENLKKAKKEQADEEKEDDSSDEKKEGLAKKLEDDVDESSTKKGEEKAIRDKIITKKE